MNTRENEGSGSGSGSGSVGGGGPPGTRSTSLARVVRGNSRDGNADLNPTSSHSATPAATAGPPRLMNAPRSHVRRSQSFKRTASGASKSVAPNPSVLLTGGPNDPLNSSDSDLLGLAPPSTATAIASTSSIASLGSGAATPLDGNSAHSTPPGQLLTPTTTNAASFAGRVTTTRNFVKNFLEEDYDEEIKRGGNNSGLQFDAETQRNVHRSLLSATPDSPPSANSSKANLSSHSRSIHGSSPQASLFQKRDDFYNVDQSVNLMDAEAGKYESKHSRKERPGSGTSMVEIFLKENNPNDANSKSRRGYYTQWLPSFSSSSVSSKPSQHTLQRQQQWHRMSAWEKLINISRRFMVPLILLSIFVIVVLIAVVIHYGAAEDPDSSPTTLAPGPSTEEQAQAMEIYLKQLKLLSEKDLQDPDSAPSKALTWIQQDTIALAGLPSGDTGRRLLQEEDEEEPSLQRRLSNTAKDQLAQRYVLAVLYYSWMSDSPTGSAAAAALAALNLNPGSGKDNEQWLTATGECRWIGVTCMNEVNTLQMGVPTTAEAHDETLANNEGFVLKLKLSEHGLTGTLPTILTALAHLVALDVSHNELSGNLTSSVDWTKWSQLEHLNLGNNQFTGTLPKQWEFLERVIDIDVSNNQLVGPLPVFTDGAVKLEDLENLYLNGNALTGTIPAAFFSDTPHLVRLDLSDNKFDGPLPQDALAALKKFRFFVAKNNRLTGSLPNLAWELMDTISLEQNKLRGGIPKSLLTNAKRLRHLKLSENEFGGTLPDLLGQLTQLKQVLLDGNGFTGSVPASWGALTQLESLQLNNNALIGSVPAEVCAIGKDVLKVTADCDTGSITCDCCDKCF